MPDPVALVQSDFEDAIADEADLFYDCERRPERMLLSGFVLHREAGGVETTQYS